MRCGGRVAEMLQQNYALKSDTLRGIGSGFLSFYAFYHRFGEILQCINFRR